MDGLPSAIKDKLASLRTETGQEESKVPQLIKTAESVMTNTTGIPACHDCRITRNVG